MVQRQDPTEDAPGEARAAKRSSNDERLGEGSGSQAACGQAERGPPEAVGSWGKKPGEHCRGLPESRREG